MYRLYYIVFFCFSAIRLLGQNNPTQQEFVIKRDYVFDYENIFTKSEKRQLDSITNDCWQRGIAAIAIVTIDDNHTDNENFDHYVFNNLTEYAQGEYRKNNGIVIAISKKLRQMRIENGRGIEKILSNEATKQIIDEEFIPKFKQEKYFEGTLNGLNAVIRAVEKEMEEYNYTDASSIFQSSLFKRIRTFVLENGTPQTFRNFDSNNASYNFTSLDVFLGPSRKNAFVLKDFAAEDYYEMTIRDSNGHHYQFVCFDGHEPEQTFIKKKMEINRVYWLDPGDKFVSQDVWPLLDQIESEMAQNRAAGDPKIFTSYDWVLKQEFHPMERIYMDTDTHDTLVFDNNNVLINGKKAGTFEIDEKNRLLSLKMDKGHHPSFAIFKMDDRYHYRYQFNKTERKLYLVPLDEKEGHDLIRVEGCTLSFEILEQ